VRQFPKWRDFVRNAEKDRLTREQLAELPTLTGAVVEALRDEEARTFIDPKIPDGLENLEEPMRVGANGDRGQELQPADPRALLLAEDVVESINNIAKRAVEAALASENSGKAKSKSTARPKTGPKGLVATAKAVADGYTVEAEKSLIREGQRLGKETGPAITRWVKRFVFGGSALAGTTGTTYGLAHLLIHAFPDKFQWLLAIIPYLS
jgi:hypothetical protein